MSLKPGDRVFIIPLEKTGEIVRMRDQKTCVVQIGKLEMTCKLRDLRSLAAKKSKKSSHRIVVSHEVEQLSRRRQQGHPHSLDLHGLTVAAAQLAIEQFINDAMLAGYTEVEIVHGIGTGKLQAATEKILNRLNVVKHFSLQQHNKGATTVRL